MAITQPKVGINTGLGFGKESTWGTAVARTNWLPAADSGTGLKRTTVYLPVPELVQGSNYDVKNTFLSEETVEGGFEVLLRYDGSGLLLEALLGGTPTTSGTASPFVHTHPLGTSLPSLTIEKIRGNTGNSEVFEGCKVSSGTLSIQANQPVRLQMEVIGETAAARSSAGTPTYSTGEIMIANQVTTATFDGNAVTLESLEITVNNNISAVKEVGRSTTAEPPISNFREVRATAVLQFRDDSLYTAHHATTTGDLVVTLTGATSPNAMTVTVKNALIMSVEDEPSGPGVITQTVEFMARAATGADGISIAITNASASATAN